MLRDEKRGLFHLWPMLPSLQMKESDSVFWFSEVLFQLCELILVAWISQVASFLSPVLSRVCNPSLWSMEQQQVREQLASSDFTSEEQRLAQRSVARLATQHSDLTPSEEMTRLFCALRRVKGAQARINASLLKSWQARFEQATHVKQCFWVVPAEAESLKRDDVKPYIVPKEDIAEIPPGLLQQNVLFVDQVVERSKLGAGRLCIICRFL